MTDAPAPRVVGGRGPTDSSPPPRASRTPRAAATRASLVAAARKVFEERGYSDTRVVDVTTMANTGLGTFYRYFDDKEDVLIAVFDELGREGLHPPTLDYLAEHDVDPISSIAQHHRDYVEAVYKNIRLMRVQDEVLHVSDRFRALRKREAKPYIDATVAAIRSLQADGRADPTINPLRMARTLSVAVSRTAFVTFVIEEEGPESFDDVVETLTTLWINALKIPPHRDPAARHDIEQVSDPDPR